MPSLAYNDSVNSRFAIVSPCPKRWGDLHGDERKRHCDVCQRSVHAIERYSIEEWDQIWRESEGRVCGFLGGESPAKLRSRRVVLAGAFITAISPLMAQNGRVRVRVSDAAGAVVTTAEVSLLGADGKATEKFRANASGETVWTDLPMGDCRFAVDAPGFKRLPLTVTLHSGAEVKIDAVLELGSLGGPVIVAEWNPTAAEARTPAAESRRNRRRRWLIF